MNMLFKIAVCIPCCSFSILNIYCQKINTSELLPGHYLAMPAPVVFSNAGVTPSAKNPIVKFTMDETFSLCLNNKHAYQHLKKAVLNFSSHQLINSKIIASPIDPSSPLLHDDSHVMSLLIHAGNVFPLILKFALYL